MRVVDKEAAETAPTHHRFLPGRGYVRLGPPSVPSRGRLPDAPVRPSKAAADGSLHLLSAPNGATIFLIWRGNHWRHPSNPAAGNRVGWAPEHLGAAGWSYLRKA